MSSGYYFENELKIALQDTFPEAYVHRFKQSKRSGQDFDLVVIRRDNPFFIECKSRDVSKRVTYRLEALFEEGQLERQLGILDRTGLEGYLAFECRRGRGVPKEARLFPLQDVVGSKVSLDEPQQGVEMKRKGAQYRIPNILFGCN